jgi:hypothetical protein
MWKKGRGKKKKTLNGYNLCRRDFKKISKKQRVCEKVGGSCLERGGEMYGYGPNINTKIG